MVHPPDKRVLGNRSAYPQSGNCELPQAKPRFSWIEESHAREKGAIDTGITANLQNLGRFPGFERVFLTQFSSLSREIIGIANLNEDVTSYKLVNETA
jgi:hypothetical protein